MFDIHRVELDWGGRKLTLETGKVARQADGAVIATYGETTVIATAVAAKQPKPGIDFLPPTIDEMKESQLDLVVAGTQDAVLMVESEAKELSEEIMLGAVMFGHRHMQPVIQAIIQLAEKAAKEPRDFAQPDTKAIEKEMLGIVEKDLRKAYAIPAKHERQDAVAAVKKAAMAHFFPDGKDNPEQPMLLVAVAL